MAGLYTTLCMNSWIEMKYNISLQEVPVEEIAKVFPFTKYFENAPQPLFKGRTYAEDMDIAEGCYRYIEQIFTQLKVSLLPVSF